MSSVPGAPLPLTGPPSPPSNPWTMFGAVAGVILIVAAVSLMIVGSASPDSSSAGPVTTTVGTVLLALGTILLACSFVLAGVDWYLRHPRGATAIASRPDDDA